MSMCDLLLVRRPQIVLCCVLYKIDNEIIDHILGHCNPTSFLNIIHCLLFVYSRFVRVWHYFDLFIYSFSWVVSLCDPGRETANPKPRTLCLVQIATSSFFIGWICLAHHFFILLVIFCWSVPSFLCFSVIPWIFLMDFAMSVLGHLTNHLPKSDGLNQSKVLKPPFFIYKG